MRAVHQLIRHLARHDLLSDERVRLLKAGRFVPEDGRDIYGDEYSDDYYFSLKYPDLYQETEPEEPLVRRPRRRKSGRPGLEKALGLIKRRLRDSLLAGEKILAALGELPQGLICQNGWREACRHLARMGRDHLEGVLSERLRQEPGFWFRLWDALLIDCSAGVNPPACLYWGKACELVRDLEDRPPGWRPDHRHLMAVASIRDSVDLARGRLAVLRALGGLLVKRPTLLGRCMRLARHPGAYAACVLAHTVLERRGLLPRGVLPARLPWWPLDLTPSWQAASGMTTGSAGEWERLEGGLETGSRHALLPATVWVEGCKFEPVVKACGEVYRQHLSCPAQWNR